MSLSIKEVVYSIDLQVVMDAQVDASLAAESGWRIIFRQGCQVYQSTYRRKTVSVLHT